jgi:hypothetical protein
MPLGEAQRVANTREHLTWSYRFALFWLVLSLVIFGGAYARTSTLTLKSKPQKNSFGIFMWRS